MISLTDRIRKKDVRVGRGWSLVAMVVVERVSERGGAKQQLQAAKYSCCLLSPSEQEVRSRLQTAHRTGKRHSLRIERKGKKKDWNGTGEGEGKGKRAPSGGVDSVQLT